MQQFLYLYLDYLTFGYFNYNNYLNNEKLKNIAIAQEKILENVQTATFNLGDLPPINVNVKAPIVKDNSTYYSVIAGAFRSRRNAEKHLNTLIIEWLPSLIHHCKS